MSHFLGNFLIGMLVEANDAFFYLLGALVLLEICVGVDTSSRQLSFLFMIIVVG